MQPKLIEQARADHAEHPDRVETDPHQRHVKQPAEREHWRPVQTASGQKSQFLGRMVDPMGTPEQAHQMRFPMVPIIGELDEHEQQYQVPPLPRSTVAMR